jgi:hypothetical protein
MSLLKISPLALALVADDAMELAVPRVATDAQLSTTVYQKQLSST